MMVVLLLGPLSTLNHVCTVYGSRNTVSRSVPSRSRGLSLKLEARPTVGNVGMDKRAIKVQMDRGHPASHCAIELLICHLAWTRSYSGMQTRDVEVECT